MTPAPSGACSRALRGGARWYDVPVSVRAFVRPGAVVLAGSLLFAGPGCSADGLIEIPTPPDGGGGIGASSGSGPGGQGGAGGQGGQGGGAAVSPVLVGITPTPSAQAPAAELEAQLTSLAAGARAAVLAVPWDAEPEAAAAALSKKAAFYAQQERRVLLRLEVVDRLTDRRPASTGDAAWNAPETIAALQGSIDWMLASSGDEVRWITFGRDVDVYLAAHPDERPAFVAFVKQAAAYAKAHPDAPAQLAVGVGMSAEAPKSEPAFQELIDAQDVLAFSYFPGLGTSDPGASSGVAATVTQIADAAGQRPIVLDAAGFAADPAAGGGEDAQQKFFATLFGAVAARRASFALVDVVELYDAPPSACEAWAGEQGEPPGGPLAAYACSLGLFRADGTPRPAWSAVLAGSAALSTP